MRNPPKKSSRYEILDIPLELIDYDKQQVRDVQVDDEIHELAASIAAIDILQFPGVVRKDDGRFDLAWGRRRLEAYRSQHETVIPCRVYSGPLKEIKALALVENMQRRAMSIEEECRGVAHLYEERHLSIDQIVSSLGRTRTWVLQRLAVPNFKPDVREALLAGSISLGAAEALEVCDEESARAYILSQTIHQKLTIPEVRAMVQTAKDMPPQDEAIEAGLAVARTPVASQPTMIPCALCGLPDLLDNLIFVRIHRTPCTEVNNESLSPNDAA